MNADDLGLHVAVRRAVEALAEAGVLGSASVLANGPDVEQAVRVRGVSLGAHLNILRGRPVSPLGDVRSLVGRDGRFAGSFARLYLMQLARRLDLDEVELEWTRQVERLRALGARLTHIDGEKHTHALPRLRPIAERVAAKFRIPFVRVPRERWRGTAPLRGQARVLALRWWLRHVGPVPRDAEHVWGIADQGERLTPKRFAADLGRATGASPPGSITSRTIEIVCHPGLEHAGDGEIDPAFGSMRVRDLWRPEYESLRSGPWRTVLADHGWRLASFDDLTDELRP